MRCLIPLGLKLSRLGRLLRPAPYYPVRLVMSAMAPGTTVPQKLNRLLLLMARVIRWAWSVLLVVLLRTLWPSAMKLLQENCRRTLFLIRFRWTRKLCVLSGPTCFYRMAWLRMTGRLHRSIPVSVMVELCELD